MPSLYLSDWRLPLTLFQSTKLNGDFGDMGDNQFNTFLYLYSQYAVMHINLVLHNNLDAVGIWHPNFMNTVVLRQFIYNGLYRAYTPLYIAISKLYLTNYGLTYILLYLAHGTILIFRTCSSKSTAASYSLLTIRGRTLTVFTVIRAPMGLVGWLMWVRVSLILIRDDFAHLMSKRHLTFT